MKSIASIIVLSLVLLSSCAKKQLPGLNFDLETASVKTGGDKLIVSTGKVKRIWKLTNAGLVTDEFKDLITGEIYTSNSKGIVSDWSYFGLVDNHTNGISQV